MGQFANHGWTLVILVLLVIGLFDGVRRMAARGRSGRLVLQVVFCALGNALLGLTYFELHQQEDELIRKMNYGSYTQLGPNWAKGLSIEESEKNSKSFASVAFIDRGIFLNHLDSKGQWVRFQPTEQDIAKRENAVALRTTLAEQSNTFWLIALEYWVGSLIALLAGLGVGVREKRGRMW